MSNKIIRLSSPGMSELMGLGISLLQSGLIHVLEGAIETPLLISCFRNIRGCSFPHACCSELPRIWMRSENVKAVTSSQRPSVRRDVHLLIEGATKP